MTTAPAHPPTALHPARRSLGGALWRILLGALLLAAALRAQDGAAPATPSTLAATRSALDRWVEVRQLISQEKRDWQLAREMLSARVAVLRRELELLRARVATTQESVQATTPELQKLQAETAASAAATAGLLAATPALEAQTRRLLQRLPALLAARVDPAARRLQAATADLPLPERLQAVLTVLREADKWQQQVVTATEQRQVADDVTASVTTLYLGLGQAFYASADGRHAGRGVPGAEGWTWQPLQGEDAAAVVRAIAILQGREMADHVRLPVRIQ